MGEISTLVYMLESLEGERRGLIDTADIFDPEESFMKDLSGKLDQTEFSVSPKLVREVLQKSGILHHSR